MKNKIMSVVLTLSMMLSCLASAGFVAEARTTDVSEVSAVTDSETTSADCGLADNVQDGQILQCWNWSYNGIKDNMAKIAEQGFSAIQTSPIQTIKETTQNRQMSGSWWVYYQPSNFSIETNGQNACGTKAEFEAMCDEAHKYGIKVIVDAVLNHLANKGNNTISDTIPSDIRDDASCWHDVSVNSWYATRYDITQYCMGGLPDLNTSNTKIQNYAISFLKEAIDAGADGFRFDGAKHIETPVDDGFSSQFWPNVLGAATSYAQSTRGFTPYYYGEILDKVTGDNDTGNASKVLSYYTSVMSVTTSSVSNSIRNSVNSGNANGAKRSDYNLDDGSSAPANKAVLWNESHDTYASGKSSGQSDATLKKTWAMVGSRANSCSLYLARPRNYSDLIGTASVTAWGDKEVKAVNQFKNYFIGESEYLSSEGSIAYNERGTEGVVLVNCSGFSTSVNVTAHKMASGTYIDQVTGNTFTVSNGKISGQIGDTGVAVVYNAEPAGPSASVTPGSKTYTDTLTLTLNYENATSGQYSIDGGAYKSFTDGQQITIGKDLSYVTKTTVTVKASNGTETSDAETYTYTKVDPSAVQKVYFDNSSYNWSDVYAYIYVDESQENSAWPGEKMTKDPSTGYCVLEVPENLADGYVIFTESASATNNRYPADGEDGMPLAGRTMIMRAGYSWTEYTEVPTTTAVPTTIEPTTVEPTTQPQNKVLIGDVNLNGKITISDATEIQMHINSYTVLNGDNAVAADTDKNGVINIKDATAIQCYIAGMSESSAHCGEYTGGQGSETQPTTQPVTEPEKNYLYFKNTNNWSNVMAYYWSEANTTMVTWPGVATENMGDGVYRVEVPSDAEMIIFNNGSGGNGNQTADIKIEGYNMIYQNGAWSKYNG